MRNDELFNPNCQDDRAKKLVTGYAMRGLMGERGTYSPENLLARQHAVYEEWLAAIRERTPTFDCGFYEWMSRSCDAAFVFKPGDLVKHAGRYCVVAQRYLLGAGWVASWRLRNGRPTEMLWPKSMCTVELKDSDSSTRLVDVLSGGIEPADIPPEVFALACGRAKDCPMMKGGAE